MEIKSIRAFIIERSQDLFTAFQGAFDESLQEKNIICVTSKVVSLEQRKMVKLSEVKPSAKAREMKKLRYSKEFDIKPERYLFCITAIG